MKKKCTEAVKELVLYISSLLTSFNKQHCEKPPSQKRSVSNMLSNFIIIYYCGFEWYKHRADSDTELLH